MDTSEEPQESVVNVRLAEFRYEHVMTSDVHNYTIHRSSDRVVDNTIHPKHRHCQSHQGLHAPHCSSLRKFLRFLGSVVAEGDARPVGRRGDDRLPRYTSQPSREPAYVGQAPEHWSSFTCLNIIWVPSSSTINLLPVLFDTVHRRICELLLPKFWPSILLFEGSIQGLFL